MKHEKTFEELSETSRAILHQGWTDMITPLIVQRRFFPGGKLDSARSALRRLCGDPPGSLFLRPEPLDAHRVYYLLTRLGTRVLGVSPKYSQSLKRTGKIKRYALAWFLHADQPGKRQRIRPPDFANQFGVGRDSLPCHPYFLDMTTDQPRLGMVLVDHNAHPRRVVNKTIKPLVRFIQRGWFDDLIRQQCFVMTVLTFNTDRQKAFKHKLSQEIPRRLGHALARLDTSGENRLPIVLDIRVIPGLESLVIDDSNTEQRT